jgi:geranylgeranyl reductase family protein
MRQADVLVVGAGPAGAAAAFHAAAGGLSTILIDRHSFPRAKVCGDGLSPRALEALERMNVGDVMALGHQIRGIRVVGKSASNVLSFSKAGSFEFGVVIPRVALDDRLRLAAVRVGCQFIGGTTVKDLHLDRLGAVRGVWVDGPTGQGLIEAKLTVLADGATGRLSATVLGELPSQSRHTAFAVRQYVEGASGMEPYFDIHVPIAWRGRRLVGYGWVFPVTDSVANIGIGVTDRESTPSEQVLREMLEGFVADLLERNERFRHAHPLDRVEGGALNARMADQSRAPHGVWLVGDAAGLVNAFTGEGIAYALESGELAGRRAHQFIRRSTVHMSFAGDMRGAFPHRWSIDDPTNYYRWLISLAPTLFDHAQLHPLRKALTNIVLDERKRDNGPSAPRINGAELAQRLADTVQARAVAVIGNVDPVVSQLVRDLLLGSRRCAVPMIIPAAVADHSALGDARYVDSLAAVALLMLAYELLDSTGHESRSTALDDGSVVIADCLTTEAMGLLAHVPAEWYALVVHAFGRVARAALGRSAEAEHLRGYYDDVAQPVIAAALVCHLATSCHRDIAPPTIEYAQWVGRVHLAILDLSVGDSDALETFVRDQLTAPPPPPPGWEPSLRAVTADLQAVACSVLGTSIPRDRRSRGVLTSPSATEPS